MASEGREGLLRAVTRRGLAVLAGAPAASLALMACAGPGPAPPGAGGAGGAAKLSGTVELWSNSGYAYKDRTGARLAQEFEQQHPGLKVNWTDTPYADFMSKLVTTAVAGNPPDISYADRYVTKSFACKGAAAPLDEYVKRSRTVKLDNLWPQMRSDVTYNGKLYGMPHQGGVGLVWFNRNHFKEAGLDPAKPPTTWDQTVQAVQRLTRRAGTATERAGWVPQRGWGVPWMVMYWQLGGELLDSSEKKAVFNNDKATQVFDWLLRVHDLQGGEDAITELYAGANANDAFAQGKVSMVWAPNSTWRAQWASRSELDVGNTFWPTPPGGQAVELHGGLEPDHPQGGQEPGRRLRLPGVQAQRRPPGALGPGLGQHPLHPHGGDERALRQQQPGAEDRRRGHALRQVGHRRSGRRSGPQVPDRGG